MAETMIEPALSAEEWRYIQAGGLCVERRTDEGHFIYCAGSTVDGRHVMAALALYGQPFGFTQEDVAQQLEAATYFDAEALCADMEGLSDGARGFRESAARHRVTADRIAALLPPIPLKQKNLVEFRPPDNSL